MREGMKRDASSDVAPAGAAAKSASLAAVWRQDRTIRLESEELARCKEEQAALDRGEAHAGVLRETPRRKDERNLLWSEALREERRRRERTKAYDVIYEREQAADAKLAGAHGRAHVRGRLPRLHDDMLRRPGVGNDSNIFAKAATQNVNISGPHKLVPLHLAILQQKPKILSQLLAQGACRVDVQDAAGYTALHHALTLGSQGLEMAKMLVDAGADMTVRNRAGLNPIESALALHLYNEMAIFLEQFSTWDLACCIARRFFLDYFSGDPVYHHYKNLNYEHAIFMAYAVVMHPSALRGGLQIRMKLRQFFNKERTMNNLERFFHDIRGDHRYDASKNGRFDFHTPLKQKYKDEPLKKQLLQAHKNLEAKEALRRGGSQKALNNGATGNGRGGGGGGGDDNDDDDDDERDELDLIPFGMFVEFKRSKLRRWHTKAQAWDFSKCPDRIARFAFQGRLSSKEISKKLTQGRQAFADWRDANRQTLRDDEDRRLRQVADAVRLRKLRKDRAAKLEQQRIEEERIRQERAKKGLDKMDPDAKVVLSGAEVVYDIDEGQTSAMYTICLGTRPIAPVLVKLSVISAPTATALDAVDDGTKDQTQFLIRPTLVTFTPKNWEEPRQVEVWPKDDDALVRMKRKVTQGPAGVCDHKLVHVIPSTTDWSYKHPDLVWDPVQDPILSVV